MTSLFPVFFEWTAYVALFTGFAGLVFAVLAIVLAGQQLQLAKRVARGQLILAVDVAFFEFRNLRDRLNTSWDLEESSDVSERNEVRRYLAVFEGIGMLVQDDLLTLDRVRRRYAPRLVKLLKKEGVRKLVEEAEPEDWDDFRYLCRELYGPGKDNRLPFPPEGDKALQAKKG